LKAQREADERAMEPRKLASMGYSVEEIIEELERIKLVSTLLLGLKAICPSSLRTSAAWCCAGLRSLAKRHDPRVVYWVHLSALSLPLLSFSL